MVLLLCWWLFKESKKQKWANQSFHLSITILLDANILNIQVSKCSEVKNDAEKKAKMQTKPCPRTKYTFYRGVEFTGLIESEGGRGMPLATLLPSLETFKVVCPYCPQLLSHCFHVWPINSYWSCTLDCQIKYFHQHVCIYSFLYCRINQFHRTSFI